LLLSLASVGPSKLFYLWSHLEHPLCHLVNPPSSFDTSSDIFSCPSLPLAHYAAYYLRMRTFAYSLTLRIFTSKHDYSRPNENRRNISKLSHDFLVFYNSCLDPCVEKLSCGLVLTGW
jgi:hypothetical protein